MYLCRNKPQNEATANPNKYPQGFFNDKKCRCCGNMFSPIAPSHMYCSQECADIGIQDAYLKRTYNINTKDYYRMHKEQNGLCKLCNKEGFLMAKYHKIKLVVDHDHVTGKVRGLLCHNCNRALGLFKEDTKALLKAIEYLESATTIPNGSTLETIASGSGEPVKIQ